MPDPLNHFRVAAKISADFGINLETSQVRPFLEGLNRACQLAAQSGFVEGIRHASAPALPPVEGDLLPAVGSEVLIHLASSDKWVKHKVVGYYVWDSLARNGANLYRVFIRVVDQDGIPNARMLNEIRPVEAETQPTAQAEN